MPRVSERGRIVELLRSNALVEFTVDEVAKALNISSLTARRHLKALVAENTVSVDKSKPSGKGRPPTLYWIT